MFYSLVSTQIKIPDSILLESYLISILHLVRALSLCEDIARHGRPCDIQLF